MRVFDNQWAVLLTTFRRNGVGIATVVNLAVEGDHGYFRTYARAGKLKRIRRNPDGQVAPCSPTGELSGPAVSMSHTSPARARGWLTRSKPSKASIPCSGCTRVRRAHAYARPERLPGTQAAVIVTAV